jgi:hypothetical protein
MRWGRAAAAAAMLLALGGCAAEPAKQAPTTMTFTDVTDSTGTDYYKLGATAEGTTDEFGSTLTLDVSIINANQIKFKPKATITWRDGTTTVCVDEDLRHVPSVQKTTTEVELPCPDGFADSAEGATINVIDEYN